MKKIKVFENVLKIVPAGLLVPFLTLAQSGLVTPPKPTGVPGASNDKVSDVLLFYIEVVLGLVGLIAVAFLIYGGFRYITSAGNEEVAEGAKKTIQNAIIGLIVVVLSYVIVTVIINTLRTG